MHNNPWLLPPPRMAAAAVKPRPPNVLMVF
jgi:hypothetical protein